MSSEFIFNKFARALIGINHNSRRKVYYSAFAAIFAGIFIEPMMILLLLSLWCDENCSSFRMDEYLNFLMGLKVDIIPRQLEISESQINIFVEAACLCENITVGYKTARMFHRVLSFLEIIYGFFITDAQRYVDEMPDISLTIIEKRVIAELAYFEAKKEECCQIELSTGIFNHREIQQQEQKILELKKTIKILKFIKALKSRANFADLREIVKALYSVEPYDISFVDEDSEYIARKMQSCDLIRNIICNTQQNPYAEQCYIFADIIDPLRKLKRKILTEIFPAVDSSAGWNAAPKMRISLVGWFIMNDSMSLVRRKWETPFEQPAFVLPEEMQKFNHLTDTDLKKYIKIADGY